MLLISGSVSNDELASLWNLFESLQSRSIDNKFGLDKEIFFQFINLTVSPSAITSFHQLGTLGTPTFPSLLGHAC